ncbi:mechanosensitive ion channel domain-containing protein [Thaumasiovibrio sp. DFM-14]|uniref:mechanosensitive ion channel domain-containing protein n=1 Tax=Thaumasiovibrio sp. DFM-14 TaxID=3384792 RepID=UPI0039A180DD
MDKKKLMQPINRLFLLILLVSPFLLFAESASPPIDSTYHSPEIETIQQWQESISNNIDQLEQRQQTPDVVALLERYLDGKTQLQSIITTNRRIQQLTSDIEQFTQQREAIVQAINRFSTQALPPINNLDIDELKAAIEQQKALIEQQTIERQTLRKTLQEIDLLVNDYPELHAATTDNVKKQERQLERSNNKDTLDNMLTQLAISDARAQLQLLEIQYRSASNRFVLSELKLELIGLSLDTRQAYLNNLNRTLRERERPLQSVTEREESNATGILNLDHPELLQELLSRQQRIQNELVQLETDIAQTQVKQSQTKKIQQTITTTSNELDQIAEWLKLSPAFTDSFRRRIEQLPPEAPIQNLEESIARNQLNKYSYQQRSKALLEQSTLPSSSDIPLDQQAPFAEALESNSVYTQQVIDLYDDLIFEQATLLLLYEETNNALNSLKKRAEKLLFLAPNVNPASLEQVTQTWLRIQWFLSPSHWVSGAKLVADLSLTVIIGLPLIIALTLFIYGVAKRSWKRYLKETAKKIGKVTQDSIRYSFINAVICFFLALPIPFIISLVSYALESAWQYPFWHHIGQALSITPILLVYLTIRELSRPNGLLIAHFGWQESTVALPLKLFTQLMWMYIPLTIMQMFALHYSDTDINATLGRLAFVFSNIAISVFLWRMGQAKLPLTYADLPEGKVHFQHHLFWGVLTLTPQILSFFALKGYLAASQAIMQHLAISAVIGVLTLLIYFLIKRLMLIQKRRLAFERAKARRIEQLMQRQAEASEQDDGHSHNESHPEIEDEEIDLDQISDQSLRLLRSLLLIIYLIALGVFWSDLYQASTLLQEVIVWDASSNIDGLEKISAITLRSLVLSLLAFVLTLLLSRDLPAAMELLVLQHLSLSPGSGYAITTLTRYVVIVVGILVGSAYLGFDWSKMQWLVAALGVGLGFGLQEIFANFISGLILLFERPIRIGDTVTIRNLTGTIAKINTRATTIVDWDRKEVIVPNKAFVTEQFVNWSLSDAITRVKIAIDVNYLADSDLVTELLAKAANECELVLEAPSPEVFFLGLSANIQQFEVRAYAAETDHRLRLTHDLHKKIREKFIQHGILLAPPQLQVQIENPVSDVNPTIKGR